jgi:hypothetical protein
MGSRTVMVHASHYSRIRSVQIQRSVPIAFPPRVRTYHVAICHIDIAHTMVPKQL